MALSVVSLLNDLSSEMIYPLLPVFLTAVLGAGPAFLGVVEGLAESVASLLKWGAGWWSDRVGSRKRLVVWGYGLASVARPLVAAAQAPWHVLAVRVADRVGKGVRTAPRDALLADSALPDRRGLAFSFHRAMDHAGAVLGPAVAFGLLALWPGELRRVFWLAAVPAAAAVAVLLLAVREPGRAHAPGTPAAGSARDPAAPGAGARGGGSDVGSRAAGADPAGAAGEGSAGGDAPAPARIPRRFWGYLAAVLLFTLGNSTDAFLLLRAHALGVGEAWLPVLWGVLHVSKMAWSVPGGLWSDRAGRRAAILAGWAVYAGTYVAFGFAHAPWHAWALFAAYGLFYGLTEGPERALVVDLVPAARRATALGAYHLAVGAGALPASVLFGVVWERWGARAAFLLGAGLATAAAAVFLAALGPRERTARPPARPAAP